MGQRLYIATSTHVPIIRLIATYTLTTDIYLQRKKIHCRKLDKTMKMGSEFGFEF